MSVRWALPLVGLILVFGCSRGDPYIPSEGVSVDHYDLALSVNPEDVAVEGVVQFDLYHPDTLEMVDLRAGDLDIDTIFLNGDPASYQRDGDLLLIELQRDTLSTVEIAFSGRPDEGLYRETYNGSTVIYTDSWPYRAEHWWPAIHHPSVPATWTLTLDHPPGSVPVASGEQIALDTLAGRISSAWELNDSAPTYSMAIALGPFTRLEGGAASDVPIHHYLLDDVADIPQGLHRTSATLTVGIDSIGLYPYSSFSSVQIPFQWAGMENAGKAFLNADRYEGTKALEEVMGHEVFHQWFGNHVSIAAWRDLWLSEGITTYLATLFYELADGQEDAAQRRIEMAELSSSDVRNHHVMVPDDVRDPWDHLTWVPYRKGGSVIHLLRLKLGDERFFDALRLFYAESKGTSQSTEDFKMALESHGDVNLDNVFDVWVYGSVLPRLEYTWDASSQVIEWEVTRDKNVLDDVPWEVQICQQNRCELIDGPGGTATLPSTEPPSINPVGIMMEVD